VNRTTVVNLLSSIHVGFDLHQHEEDLFSRCRSISLPRKILKFPKEITVGEFIVNNDGVFYRDVREDEEERILVCSFLLVVGITRNKHGQDWGKQLVFVDPEGQEKQYHMSSAKNPNVIISDLVHRGLVLSSNSRSRNLLAQ
jgi:hypothetical protein